MCTHLEKIHFGDGVKMNMNGKISFHLCRERIQHLAFIWRAVGEGGGRREKGGGRREEGGERRKEKGGRKRKEREGERKREKGGVR